MGTSQSALSRPIRVVMFGSGPELSPDVKEFLCRLEENPEIELLAAFFEAASQSTTAVIKDLWKRRGWLSLPLFMVWIGDKVLRFLLHRPKEAALKKNLEKISARIHFVPNIHAEEVLDSVCTLEPDLGLIYGSPILKPVLFELPKLGTLGIHHGKVPEYRGNKTTFWAMYNGEPSAGVTIQKVNKGLDTGTIVKTGEVTTYRRSYQTVFRELEALGLELYIQAILEVKQGIAKYTPQTGNKGKAYRNPKLIHFIKFWGKQAKQWLKTGK